MKSNNWECPFCHSKQAVTDSRRFGQWHVLSDRSSSLGSTAAALLGIVCSNDACRELTIFFSWCNADIGIFTSGYTIERYGEFIESRRLRPESSAKPQPEYIPEQIRQDYYEACKIRDLSAKASATLARRCLQGMIRDFCNIKEKSLYKEIEKLQTQIDEGNAPRGVTPDHIDAIDSVRKIGNIGAHMEKDINHIVEIDPYEAEALIGLIEMLFEEWYISNHKRKQRIQQIQEISGEKELVRKNGTSHT